jgi:hypothetical protein
MKRLLAFLVMTASSLSPARAVSLTSLTILRNQHHQLLYIRKIPMGMPLGQAAGTGIPSQQFHGYDAVIMDAASFYAIDPLFLKAIIQIESRFNARAVSPKGARNLSQLMPGTARTLGVSDLTDPYETTWGAAALIRRLMDHYDGNMIKIAAAYNAGEEPVDRANGVPRFPETRAYVPAVLWAWDRMHRFHEALARQGNSSQWGDSR